MVNIKYKISNTNQIQNIKYKIKTYKIITTTYQIEISNTKSNTKYYLHKQNKNTQRVIQIKLSNTNQIQNQIQNKNI